MTKSSRSRVCYADDLQDLGGSYAAMSSIKTMQHGGLLGPNLSSVIDNELWGRDRALWQSVDCSIPFTLRFLTFLPCSFF